MGYKSGYTHGMKTAISLPDDVYMSAEKLAKERGVPRSHIYVLALRSYLVQQRGEKVMEQYNAYFANEKNDLDPGLRRAQTRSLLKSTEGDEW
jgi:metal-responsive CopG/Arc/MetJ family transcriptional regulator